MTAFPSYAKSLGQDPVMYGDIGLDEILLTSAESGETWRIGRTAQDMVGDLDTSDSERELFGRERYYSESFRILVEAGLGLALMKNSCGGWNGEDIHVETGLPPAYLHEDSEALREVIAGKHRFAIKTASGSQAFDFEIAPENVTIIGQPEGTLASLSTDNNAHGIRDARRYFNSRVLIFDAGFGTLDLFEIANRTSRSKETFPEYGMRAVLSATRQKISDKMGVVLGPSAMQRALETGTVLLKKRKGLVIESKKEDFTPMLKDASDGVCRGAVEKIMNLYGGLFDYDYLILTGGCSAPWEAPIREYFKNVDGLTVVMGNENEPTLPIIFCNVRGYYMHLVGNMRHSAKKA